MTIRELLSQLRAAGVTIRCVNGQMSASPKEKVSPAMLAALKAKKAMLFAAYADPLVVRLLHAVDGRITDVRKAPEQETFP